MNYLIFFSGAAFGFAFLFICASLVVIFSKKMTQEQRLVNERVYLQLCEANQHRESAVSQIGRLAHSIDELNHTVKNK